MPTGPTRPSARPQLPLPATDLAVLAGLADARAASEGATPCLLRVQVVGDEVELGWLPLAAGSHPLDELVGRTAPDEWAAVGVVADGRARRLDTDVPPVRVRTTHLVGRDGSWASRCTGADVEPLIASGEADDPGRVAGRLDDACRRVLGLPTAPADVGTGPLWAARWLDAVVAAAAASTAARARMATWPEVARLHPAVPALDGAGPAAAVPDPDELGERARTLASWRDWSVLRRACAAGMWSTPEVDAEAAAWLDDGAFCRWALGAFPDLEDLLVAVADLLPASVTARIVHTLVVAGVAP